MYILVYIYEYSLLCVCLCLRMHVRIFVYLPRSSTDLACLFAMGWLRLVGSIKLSVPIAKEPYKRDYTLQKRPIILSIRVPIAKEPYKRDYTLQKRPIILSIRQPPPHSFLDSCALCFFGNLLVSQIVCVAKHSSLLTEGSCSNTYIFYF